MKVKDLIAHLQTLDQELEVCRSLHSEQLLLERADIGVTYCCEPRPDGWVQDARPDKPVQQYVRIG